MEDRVGRPVRSDCEILPHISVDGRFAPMYQIRCFRTLQHYWLVNERQIIVDVDAHARILHILQTGACHYCGNEPSAVGRSLTLGCISSVSLVSYI